MARLKTPDVSGIKRGAFFKLSAKIGGEMQLVSVMAKCEPYQKGKQSMYVDVFGYGVPRRAVNVKKLRVITKVDD